MSRIAHHQTGYRYPGAEPLPIAAPYQVRPLFSDSRKSFLLGWTVHKCVCQEKLVFSFES